MFFLVEKIVRRAEELSVGNTFGHSHNHHKPRKEVPASQKVKESQTETIEGNGSNSKKGMRKVSRSRDRYLFCNNMLGNQDGFIDEFEGQALSANNSQLLLF